MEVISRANVINLAVLTNTDTNWGHRTFT